MYIELPRDKLLWTGTWEKHIAELISSQVSQGKAALDIGSHRGFMAGVMALAGASRVLCFEPNPNNISRLEELCSLNPSLPFEILPFALSDTNGTAEFSVMPEDTMGKLSDSSFQIDELDQQRFEVDVRTLDTICLDHDIGEIGMIKIDVEGAEGMVLQGAERVLREIRPILIIEIHTYELLLEIEELLQAYGYEVRLIDLDRKQISGETFRVCHVQASVAHE